MANFFGKPKANSARASPAQDSDAGAAVSGSSSGQSAFDKTFKPFVAKRDAEVAPTNWFLDPKTNKLHRKGGRQKDVIVIDADDEGTKNDIADVEMEHTQEVPAKDFSQMNAKGLSSDKHLSPVAHSSASRTYRNDHLVPSTICRRFFHHCSPSMAVSTASRNSHYPLPAQ
jgi:hypothetical protein